MKSVWVWLGPQRRNHKFSHIGSNATGAVFATDVCPHKVAYPCSHIHAHDYSTGFVLGNVLMNVRQVVKALVGKINDEGSSFVEPLCSTIRYVLKN